MSSLWNVNVGQIVLMLLIIIIGILLITGSGISGTTATMEPFLKTGFVGLFVVMTPFMFVGFDVIPQASKEINLPKRRIGALEELHPKYRTPHKAIILIAVLSTMAPLLGRPALVWFVDAGGIGLVIGWSMVALSFVILRKKAPEMERPFKLRGGSVIGWIATILAFGIATLYLPGMPSALGIPEWIITGFWFLIGAIFYNYSMRKYGKENSEEHMKKEIDRIA